MIVADYRNDEAPKLAEALAGMAHITLERLDETAVKLLSASILGESGTRPELVQMIQQQSEGNTLFIIETMRALAEESGGLEKVTTTELPQVVFTGNMQELMQRRLSKVDTQYSEIQTMAAVIGREMDTKLLAHAFNEATVSAWLNNAAQYSVVRIQDNAWRFAHDKLRETLIADIPVEDVPDLHRTAAEAIETVYPDDTAYNEALLYHWQQVDDFDKIYYYTLPVAENMIKIKGTFATAEALMQNLLGHLPPDDARRITPLNSLAVCVTRLGNYGRGEYIAEQVRQLATIHDDLQGLASSLNTLGNIARDQSDYERAMDLLQQCLTIRQETGDQRGIAASLNNLGLIAAEQGDYERAIDLYQQSLAIFQQLGDQRAIATSLNNLGVIAANQGNYEEATDLFQQSLAISQQLGDQRGIAGSLSNLGVIAANQGNYEKANDLHQQSLGIRRQLGDQQGIVSSLDNIGWIMLRQHDLEAIAFSHEGLAIATRINTPRLIIHFVVTFVGILIHKTQMERAAQLLGFVQAHPLNQSDLQQRIDELMPQLEAALAPDELQTALERGRELDLDSVVQALLAEFGGDEKDVSR